MNPKRFALATVLGAMLSGGALAQFPSTDVLLIDLPPIDGAPQVISADAVTYITDDEGYDNQPSFTPDGSAILYVSEEADGQTEIYRFVLETGERERVTATPESEFSPTVTPDGEHISAVRIEADGVTQRLWQFDLEGQNPQPNPEDVARIGYYAFVDADTLALVRVDEETNGLPLSLHITRLSTGETEQVAENVGVGVQKVPDQEAVSYVQRLDDGSVIMVLDVNTQETRELIETLPEVDAHAFSPDGALLMAQDDTIYSWREGQADWQPFLDFSEAGVSGIGRLAVSPDGSKLAFVINK